MPENITAAIIPRISAAKDASSITKPFFKPFKKKSKRIIPVIMSKSTMKQNLP
jgi:hypothetical protein